MPFQSCRTWRPILSLKAEYAQQAKPKPQILTFVQKTFEAASPIKDFLVFFQETLESKPVAKQR